MRKLHLLLIVLFILSCGNDDDNPCSDTLFLPPPEGLYLKLVDSAGDALIGTTFVQDSFKLSNTNATVYLKPDNFGAQDELFVWFSTINSGETYFLELSETDTDTLTIEYSLKNGKCFDFITLDKFTYNNILLYDQESIGDGFYPIAKD